MYTFIILCDYKTPTTGFYGLVHGAFDTLELAQVECERMNFCAVDQTSVLYYWIVSVQRNTAFVSVVENAHVNIP